MIWIPLFFSFTWAAQIFPSIQDAQFDSPGTPMNWEALDGAKDEFRKFVIGQQVEQLFSLTNAAVEAYITHGAAAQARDPLRVRISGWRLNNDPIESHSALFLTAVRWTLYRSHATRLKQDTSDLFERALFLLTQCAMDTRYILQVLGHGLFDPAKHLAKEMSGDYQHIRESLLAMRNELTQLKVASFHMVMEPTVRVQMHLHASLLTRLGRLCYMLGGPVGYQVNPNSPIPVWRFAASLAEGVVLRTSARPSPNEALIHCDILHSTIQQLLFHGNIAYSEFPTSLAIALWNIRTSLPLQHLSPQAISECRGLLDHFETSSEFRNEKAAKAGEELVASEAKKKQRQRRRKPQNVQRELQLTRQILPEDETTEPEEVVVSLPPATPKWSEFSPSMQMTMLLIVAQHFREEYLLPLADQHDQDPNNEAFNWKRFIETLDNVPANHHHMALIVQERNWHVHSPSLQPAPNTGSSSLDAAIKATLTQTSKSELLIEQYGSISKGLAEHTLQMVWAAKACSGKNSRECKLINQYRNGYLHPRLVKHQRHLTKYITIIDPTFTQ